MLDRFLSPTPANLRLATAAFLVCQIYTGYLLLQVYAPRWLP